MDTPLDLLAAQVRAHRPLTAARIDELLGAARRGAGAEAAGALVEHHLGIALDSAIAHRGHQVEVVDLFQEGSLAMVAGVAGYAASGGAGTGLAAHLRRIVDERLDEITAEADDRAAAAEALLRDTRIVEAAEVALRGRLDREPEPAEIAAVLEWSEERVRLLLAGLAEARRIHDLSLLPFLDDADSENGGGVEGESED